MKVPPNFNGMSQQVVDYPNAYRARQETEIQIVRMLLNLNTALTRRQIGEAIGRGRSPHLVTTIETLVSEGKLVRYEVAGANGKPIFTYAIAHSQFGGKYQVRGFVTKAEELTFSGCCPNCTTRRRLKRISAIPRLHLFVCSICNHYHVFEFSNLVQFITMEK